MNISEENCKIKTAYYNNQWRINIVNLGQTDIDITTPPSLHCTTQSSLFPGGEPPPSSRVLECVGSAWCIHRIYIEDDIECCGQDCNWCSCTEMQSENNHFAPELEWQLKHTSMNLFHWRDNTEHLLGKLRCLSPAGLMVFMYISGY